MTLLLDVAVDRALPDVREGQGSTMPMRTAISSTASRSAAGDHGGLVQ